MFSNLFEYTTDFYRLFFPNLCGGCDIPLTKGEQHLCVNCRLELPFTNFENIKDNPIEKMFWGRIPIHFATALLFFNKGEKVQQILHNIKYNSQKELAIYMGKILGERLQNNTYLKDVTIIMPVPLHPKKLHLRGFNQSDLFAEGINEILNKKLSYNIISRAKDTATQTKKTRIERWENVGKAFDVKHPEKLNNQHILLVDDVLTTGATLEACVESLTSKSNCKVSIVTIAVSM